MTEKNSRATEFTENLPVGNDPTRRDLTWVRLGAVVMAVGFALTIVAVILSQASDNQLDQNTQLTLAIAGLAATCLGGVLFLRYSIGRLLRYWLLRMLDLKATKAAPETIASDAEHS